VLADILGISSEGATIAAFMLAASVASWPVVKRVRGRSVGGKTLKELAFGKAAVVVDGVEVRPAEPGWNTIVPGLQADMAVVKDGVQTLLDESKPNGGHTDAPGDALKRLEDTVATMAGQVDQLVTRQDGTP
jgi:hypothetical protein